MSTKKPKAPKGHVSADSAAKRFMEGHSPKVPFISKKRLPKRMPSLDHLTTMILEEGAG